MNAFRLHQWQFNRANNNNNNNKIFDNIQLPFHTPVQRKAKSLDKGENEYQPINVYIVDLLM